MYSVQKRDGKIVEFNLSKISDAIRLAFEAQEKQFNQNIIGQEISSFNEKEMGEFLNVLLPFVPNSQLRGI